MKTNFIWRPFHWPQRKTIAYAKKLLLLTGSFGLIHLSFAQTWQSNIAKFGSNGKLTYILDANQNALPDFSYAGYKNSDVSIPQVTKIITTLSPQSGDNTSYINNAIAAAASVTPDANGIRGVILLSKGTYNINGTIKINVSGIVLRGAGSGSDAASNTVIKALGNSPAQRTVIVAGGGSTSGWNKSGTYQSNITDNFVRADSREFSVASTSGLKVGDNIIIYSPCTSAWINAVGGGGTGADAKWVAGEIPLTFNRVIKAINGNKITIDAPVFNHLNKSLAQAYIYLADRNGLRSQIGVENLRVDIQNWSNEFGDEAHAWEGVGFIQIEDAWAKNVVALHFGHAGFRMNTACRVTLDNCQALVPVATVEPERRYNFNFEDRCTNILVQNCTASKARHAYVSNGTSSVSGIVVLKSKAIDNYTSSEGHRRWSMGMLFDNFTCSGFIPGDGRELGLYSRGDYGTSHGWSLAHSVAWNCNFTRPDGTQGSVTVQQPPTAQNYVIGGYGKVNTSVPFPQYAKGYVEGFNRTDGKTLSPASLFDQQLLDRKGPGNQNPTITLTASGTSFTAPASITLNANASDPDGSVAKVEFYNGASLLATTTTAPYSFVWNNVAAGTYSITAKATDNAGAVTTSSPVNISVTNPVVESPYGGTAWPVPGIIQAENYDLGGQGLAYNDLETANQGNAYRTDGVDVQATTDAGGGYNVGYTADGEWLNYMVNVAATGTYKFALRTAGTGTASKIRIEVDGADISGNIALPNTGAWQTWATTNSPDINLTAGAHIIRLFVVTAGFNLNYINVTAVINNQTPTVSLTSSGTSFTAPASIALSANATDTDGTISKVEFFNGSSLIGTSTVAPYNFTWNNVAAGSYSITAKATDNLGGIAISSAITISVTGTTPVNQVPTVSISAPVNNSSYTAPASIAINANAADADGTISKVEFYNGTTLLSSDNTSPYSFSWTNVSAGTYSITAKATDNSGATTTSSIITVKVNTPTNTCSVPAYVENGGYVAGSQVQVSGHVYECKAWPYSGWCNGAAWAYKPGSGSAWADAWIDKGTCSSLKARMGNISSEEATTQLFPNPTTSFVRVNIEGDPESSYLLTVINVWNNEVIRIENFRSGNELNLSGLPSGMYVVSVNGQRTQVVKQ